MDPHAREAARAASEVAKLRAGWVRYYARSVAALGAVYQLVILWITMGRAPSGYDVALLALWLFLVALLVGRASPRILGVYLVVAFTVGTLLSLHAQGFLGVTGAMISTLPLCAAVFTGRSGAALAALAIVVAYAFFAYAHLSGLVDASGRVLSTSDLNSWIWLTAAFVVLAASTVSLLGRVVEDLDRAARSFLRALGRLKEEGHSRIQAERARDVALSARERSREVEALGLIAGSALHDVNNMAMVLGSWAELLAMAPDTPPEAAGAAQNIQAACRRLGTLGHDVLGLGRARLESTSPLHLDEALASAVPVLRRALPEDISLDVCATPSDALPQIALQRADLVHVLLEAVASLGPRLGQGSRILLSASSGGKKPLRTAGAVPLATLTVRHLGASASKPRASDEESLASEEEELLTTDEIAVVQRRPDSDIVELSLHRTEAPSR